MLGKMGSWVLILSFLFGPFCFAEEIPQMSAEQFYLNQESAAKFASLRKAAKKSFKGILLYPDDIRNSVLELSQYPDLIALLKNEKYLNESEFEKLLKEKPAEVKGAIDKLKAYPEIIRIMDENMVVSALLGEMVKDKKEETVQVIKRLSDSVQQGHVKAVNAWTEQMQKDPKAVQELQAAADAYAKQNKLPSPNQPMTAAQAAANPNPYGYYVDEKNTVVIQDMPSSDMMRFMMLNQTMYMMLFATAMNHHSVFDDDYYWDYYDDHFNERQDALNGISDGLDDLNNNIDEIQENRQEAREEAKEKWQEKKDDWKDRKDGSTTVQDKLQDRRDSADVKQRRETFQEKKQAAQLPAEIGSGKIQQLQNVAPVMQQVNAPNPVGQFPNVTFQPPSRQQQIERASQFHSGSWQQGSGVGNLASRAQSSRDFGEGLRGGGGAFSGVGRRR